MRAMILAAGLGTRMRPLTEHTPKPLLHVGGKPLILWHIERLKEAGFEEIVINVAYLGDQIMRYLGDGSEYGVRLYFSDERREGPLETAGGIIKALPLLSETFLVVNGDIWTDYPFVVDRELPDWALAEIIVVENPPHHPEGDFFLHGKTEKKTFSGIGYYKKRLFETLPQGKQALAPLLFDAVKQGALKTTYYGGHWYDIGTVERLEQLNGFINEDA